MSARKKVVVAMSGGVDSSVAAALLKQQGYDCVGVFMRLGHDPAGSSTDEPVACAPGGEAGKPKQGCCSTNDAADARYVAGLIDIPFYALNFEHDFSGIIDYFVREYNAGRTPNPCVRCNEYLKFGKLWRYAQAIGAEYVATGHYARVVTEEGEARLLRGKDLAKDQSYVLFGVPREALGHMLLPLGESTKPEIRKMAQAFGLPVFNKPDSQEICFVPDQDYARLVRTRTPEAVREGELIDTAGKVVGKHLGHQHFTIGQRKGIGVAFGYPIYVTGIDPATNRVTLGKKENLLHRTLVAREVNWLDERYPQGPTEVIRVYAKVRYNSPPVEATAMMSGPDELTVRFASPVAAITPGQAVVCYGPAEANGDQRLLGGAWIDRVEA